MKLTRSQKTALSVLGLAVVIFAADRVFFRPSAASAEEPPTTLLTPVPPGDGADGAAAAIAVPDRALTRRLEAIAEERGLDPLSVRDPFKAPGAGVIPTVIDGSGAFVQAHQLTGILAGRQGGGLVIVEDSAGHTYRLRIGAELKGFQLVAIKARSAVFERGIEQAELSLPEAGGSQ